MLWQMERDFWTGGTDVYRRHLAGDALLVFSGMTLDREGAIASIADAPRWSRVRFTDERQVALAGDVTALVYHAAARRAGGDADYRARVTSVYARRDGRWQLALHQQTPG